LFKHTKPDAIIGTSIGSMNGTYVAAGGTTENLEKIWHNVSRKMLFPLNTNVLYKFLKTDSIYSNANLKKFVDFHLNDLNVKNFEDLNIPTYINSTRFRDGKTIFFDKGSLRDAIIASSSVVPFYPPYSINGVRYIDGGANNFAGLKKAFEIGSRKIVLVDTGFPKNSENMTSFVDILRHSFDILIHNSIRKDLAYLKDENITVIEPKVFFSNNNHDFSHTKELILEGKLRTQEVIDKILK